MTYDDARAILTSCTHTDKPGSEYGNGKTAHGWACTECWNAHVCAWREVRKAQLAERPNDCQRCGARPHTFVYGPYRLCGRCKTATAKEHNKAMAQAGSLGIFATNLLVNTKDWAARREEHAQ